MSSFEHTVVTDIHIKDLTVDVTTMHGLNALLHWCKGFSDGGHGDVPGHFELVMHLRALKSQHRSQENN